MTMFVVIDRDDVIDGAVRVAGQVVGVPVGYDQSNIRRIVSYGHDVETANQQAFTVVTWQKFVDMFKEQYPEFLYVEEKFPELVAAVSARPALIQRLMVDPQLIAAMLASAEYAAQIIGEYDAQ